MNVVYAGPTISHQEIAQHIDCVCLPPISHGDILRVLPDNPSAIGIIDGYFEGAPSVWHKEILYAIDQGVVVYGSASMGALRAAELHAFGMQGVGQIFEWYRDGYLEDDDEVAVSHGPAELGYLLASEPLVNIRATLALACSLRVINQVTTDTLIDLAKKTYYKKRTWKGLLESLNELLDDESVIIKLGDWLVQQRINLKQLDAIQMLETMQQNLNDADNEGHSACHFEWTHVWDTAFKRYTTSTSAPLRSDHIDQQVLDELKLDPDRYQMYRDKALVSWICSDAALNSLNQVSDQGMEAALKKLRTDNQLATRPQLMTYMTEVGLDEEQLTRLLQGVARVDQARLALIDPGPGIVDQLILDGSFLKYVEITKQKTASLQSAGVNPEHADVLPPQLLAWYFEHRLDTVIPQRLENHLSRIDVSDSEDFYRLITKEYLYWRLDARTEVS